VREQRGRAVLDLVDVGGWRRAQLQRAGTYDLPASFAAGSINHADPMDMSMTAGS